MNSRAIAILCVLAAFAISYAGGQVQDSKRLGKVSDRIILSEGKRSIAQFSQTAAVLMALRKGSTNEAIEALEDQLDTHILMIGAIVEETPIGERDRQQLSRIRWLRDYRAKYPRNPTNAFAEHVAHVLSLVETNR